MNKGTISVMFSIILLFMLMFLGCILDISRCIEAEYEVYNSAEFAKISLASNYDYELNNKFHIKAVYSNNISEVENIIIENVENNLKTDNELFNWKVNEIEVFCYGSLNKDNVLIDVIEKWGNENISNFEKLPKDEVFDEYLIKILNNRELTYIFSGDYNFNVNENLNTGSNIKNLMKKLDYDIKLKRFKQVLLDNLSIRNNYDKNNLDKFYTKFKFNTIVSMDLIFLSKKFFKKQYEFEGSKYIILNESNYEF